LHHYLFFKFLLFILFLFNKFSTYLNNRFLCSIFELISFIWLSLVDSEVLKLSDFSNPTWTNHSAGYPVGFPISSLVLIYPSEYLNNNWSIKLLYNVNDLE